MKNESVLTYKGRPLLRKDDMIYYGRMSDKYILCLQILEYAEENGMNLPSKVSILLQQTDPDLRPRERVVRKSEKKSLFDALDVGSVWLERALADKM